MRLAEVQNGAGPYIYVEHSLDWAMIHFGLSPSSSTMDLWANLKSLRKCSCDSFIQRYRRLFTATVAGARPANLNAQLLHARAQRAGVEPQDFGGPIRPFDLPARSFADGGDVLSLHL